MADRDPAHGAGDAVGSRRHSSPGDALATLREELVEFERAHAGRVAAAVPPFRASARNLLHYVALRHRDLRPLQSELAMLGLSSLGRAESHALAAVDAVLAVLRRLEGAAPQPVADPPPCDLRDGAARLDEHAAALFGAPPPTRSVRVMVTVPGAAAADYGLVHDLVEAGMDCMRVNCAHDGPDEWQAMIDHLRRASAATGRHCTVLMDLAGPKLRTGAVEPGAAVRKLRPRRDALGRVVAPAVVRLVAAGRAVSGTGGDAPTLGVDAAWLEPLQPPEVAHFVDARGRRRSLAIVARDGTDAWAELDRTAYVTTATRLERRTVPDGAPATTALYGIPPREGVIPLAVGDLLLVSADAAAGRAAVVDVAGRALAPARIGCSLPEVLAQVRSGERICFDDGRIGGVVEAASGTKLRVRIRQTPPGGGRLKADRGINLPDSRLDLPALTARDREDLAFVARHADLVGLSFVNREADVDELIDGLHALGAGTLGIVLKIETQRAFACLPSLLLAAMRHERIGVMIARGDLAVECGYERLAEVQEEILWLCEAAHCPTVWATQVLETLAKAGLPSRAEITDAAMGHRAECVMLNKGPHVVHAVRALDDILRRMEAHQDKKRPQLRALGVATDFRG